MPQDITNNFQYELLRIVSQLRNHPSIVTWVTNNEGWGQFDSTRMAKMVGDLDSSRLVDKASGWLDTGDAGSDIYDIHTYEDVPNVPQHHANRASVRYGYGLVTNDEELFHDKRNQYTVEIARPHLVLVKAFDLLQRGGHACFQTGTY
jgi:beta-galactosidase/beta-glucuronidase